MDIGDMFGAEAQSKIKKRPWMDEKKFTLGTVENLASIMDACISSGRYAIDLECSGLDNRVQTGTFQATYDKIAGVGLCPDGIHGYYIPLNHAKENPGGEPIPYSCNVPLATFAKEFLRLVAATETGKTVAVFHNGKFDQEFLQFNGTGTPWGTWEAAKAWDDTYILCYLRNSRARNKRLKDLSAIPADLPKEKWSESPCGGPGLGMEMIELYELFGHDTSEKGFKYDFTTLDPTGQNTLWYACGDVICTWLLYPVLAPSVLEPDNDGGTQKAVYSIEKSAVTACRWMERNQIHVDLPRVQELVLLGHKEWFEAIKDVYMEACKILGRDITPGTHRILQEDFTADDTRLLIPEQIKRAEGKAKPIYADHGTTIEGHDGKKWPAVYDVNSPQQLGTMFDEMGVPNLKRTEKSNQVKTSKDELDRVIEEAGSRFPFMNKIKRFREVNKALSTYLYPMLKDVDQVAGLMRISFNGHKVDTGRYATSAKDGRNRMPGWPQVNFHSIPSTAFDPQHPRPECMRRIRETITARDVTGNAPPKYLVAIDFSGEELRMATNLSFEPRWVSEFFRCSGCGRSFSQDPRDGGQKTITPEPPPPRCPNCGSDRIGDLHTLTALEVYGQEATERAEWKVLRSNAKKSNFALLYGGGGSAVKRSIDCDDAEGWRIKRKFDATYPGLRSWWDKTHEFAKKHKFVRTFLGRRYPLPDIDDPNPLFRSKAERNAVNGPVQGGSADIIKIAMSLIYRDMKKRGWLDKVMMVASMHDELVFEIDADVLQEAIPILKRLMGANEILLKQNWKVPFTSDVEIGIDWSVPWDLNTMTAGEVRFIGDKKIKDASKCPAGVDFDSLPTWPASLQPWFKFDTDPVGDKGGGSSDNSGGGDSEPGSGDLRPAPVTPPRNPKGTTISADAPPVPVGQWEFHLSAPLTPDTITKLACIIVKCWHRGTHKLRILTANGQPLDLDHHLVAYGIPAPILVDQVSFDLWAKDRRL